jgi:Predicted redox protein, regulator of disulfide bond formation
MNEQSANIVELDVRPYLRKKLEPFQVIMDTVKKLEPNDIFVLHATMKPMPLFGVLKVRGLVGKAEQVAADHWVVTFVNKKNRSWLDRLGSASVEQPAIESQEKHCDAAEDLEEQSRIITLDNRGLEPPKPMIRTLSALDRLKPGDAVVIHNDRVPMFLLEELQSLGYPHTVEEQSDGSAKVTIRKT